jgi:hypothetical protein
MKGWLMVDAAGVGEARQPEPMGRRGAAFAQVTNPGHRARFW